MATVTGLTSERMKEITEAYITDASINDDGELILTTFGGQDINVGSIKGPKGDQGPAGTVTKVAGIGDDGTGNVPLKPSDFGAASQADIAAAVPIGTIVATARATAPAGWLLCQGQAVNRAGTYAALFGAIGTAYTTGSSTTTFNLPDLRSRVPVGRNANDTSFDTLGETGGAKTVALTESQMPSHDHDLYQERNSDSVSGTFGLQNGSTFFAGRVMTGITTAGRATGKTGGGAAHNNLQPYQVINYMIKY